jgi:hypothetical protein
MRAARLVLNSFRNELDASVMLPRFGASSQNRSPSLGCQVMGRCSKTRSSRSGSRTRGSSFAAVSAACERRTHRHREEGRPPSTASTRGCRADPRLVGGLYRCKSSAAREPAGAGRYDAATGNPNCRDASAADRFSYSRKLLPALAGSPS